MSAVLLVVFDGLRPDAMCEETTPNLMRFAALGTKLPHARSVFPSETRVCTASVATGCYPRRHGIMANRMFHPSDRSRIVETGDAQALRRMEQECGEAAVLRPGLSDLLAASGRDYAVFSSGTPGQTFILAPRADKLGQVVLSAHGEQSCSVAGQALLTTLPPPPHAPAERAVWIADAWRRTQLANPPAASVLWLCEPDTSSHYKGLDSSAQRYALKQADAAFGRILDEWQAGPQRERLQIIVASDHGHVAIEGHVPLQGPFQRNTLMAGCSFTGGASGGIAVPGGDADRIAAIAAYLMRQDWIGSVFGADHVDLPAGVLPRAAVLVDHARAGHVLYTLRNSHRAGATGLDGMTLMDEAVPLKPGAGAHGGLNRAELATVLMLAGSAVHPARVSDWPAGLVDIAPTILTLLGVPGALAMDGRVLGEALVEHAAPTANRCPETWEASSSETGDVHYAQRVARVRVGSHVWIEQGVRE